MQAAKDTFLRTMADRLAVVNPKRTVTLEGVTRAAVIAAENEPAALGRLEPETFALTWGDAGEVEAGRWLMFADCTVSYGSKGRPEMLGSDRGRMVTSMDCELLRMCSPRKAAKCDYTQTEPVALGTDVFWTRPVMEAAKDEDGVLRRAAKVRVFFFPEVA